MFIANVVTAGMPAELDSVGSFNISSRWGLFSSRKTIIPPQPQMLINDVENTMKM